MEGREKEGAKEDEASLVCGWVWFVLVFDVEEGEQAEERTIRRGRENRGREQQVARLRVRFVQ